MGMDSLMAVELATSIEARLDIQLSALALSGGPTIESVVERIQRCCNPSMQPCKRRAVRRLAEQVFRSPPSIAELSAEHAAAIGDRNRRAALRSP
jgi:hypothetical protein